MWTTISRVNEGSTLEGNDFFNDLLCFYIDDINNLDLLFNNDNRGVRSSAEGYRTQEANIQAWKQKTGKSV